MVEVAENRLVSLISNTFLPCSQCGVDGEGTWIATNKNLVCDQILNCVWVVWSDRILEVMTIVQHFSKTKGTMNTVSLKN